MKRLKQAACALLAASLVAGSGFASYAGPADDIAQAEATGETVSYPEKTEAAETAAETASSQETVVTETAAPQETSAPQETAAPAPEAQPSQAAPAEIPTIDPNLAVGVGQDPAAVQEMAKKNAAARQLAWESAAPLVNPIEYYLITNTIDIAE